MRNLLLIIFSLLLLAACTNSALRTQHSALAKADSLCSVQPDSALALLSQLESEMLKADKATRMYYQLLCIKASDKAYITHTSDSLIQEVLQYYIRNNDRHHLPEAYYYAGRVCRDLGDAPQALDYFQKAIDILPTEDEYELKSRIYSQMGTLFLYQDVYEEAIKANRQSLQCSLFLNDTIGIIYSLRDIGTTFTAFHQADSALHYYNQAYELAVSIKDKDMQGIVLRAMTSLYLQLGDIELAQTTLQKSLNYHTEASNLAIISLSAKLQQQIGNMDSATYYYQQLLETGDLFDCYDAHKGLAYIAQEKGNIQSALQHIEKYQLCHDSIIDYINSENILKMQSLYNYQLREKENHRLEIKNKEKERQINLIFWITLLLSASFIIYYQYSRRKREELKLQNLKLQHLKNEIYKKSQSYIENNMQRIAELEKEISKISVTNETLQKQLLEQKELIKLETRQAEIKQGEHEKTKAYIKDTKIYHTLWKRLQDPKGIAFITDAEWKEIKLVMLNYYPTFIEKLNEIYPFNQYEIQICFLIKMDFTPSAIAKLLERPKETITSTRRRLYNRIFKEKGKPENWDAFIRSL